MVGGSTRMPQIQKAVADFFGQPPLTNLDPDQVGGAGRRDPGQSSSRATVRPATTGCC
jgi:hypothetical protein